MRWLFVCIGVLALGCHEDVELDPGGASLDAAPAVDTAPPCAARGGTCVVAADCCSGVCTASSCAPVAGCAPIGELCGSGADCCSRTCAADARGVHVCQSLGGCMPAGELCRLDADCCGGAVGACAAIDPSTGIGRCVPSTGCASPGEICRVAGDGSATRDCCSDTTPSRALCHPTRVGDADRCVSVVAMSMCLAVGTACATPDECCSMVCAPSASDGLVCVANCEPNGAPCTRSADCCTGDCALGICVGTRTCAPLGSACVDSTACCSQACSASVCSAPPA